jgi:hypothetical protein
VRGSERALGATTIPDLTPRTSAVRAIACKAPRQRRDSRQGRHCRICKLQELQGPVGFESHPLRQPSLGFAELRLGKPASHPLQRRLSRHSREAATADWSPNLDPFFSTT